MAEPELRGSMTAATALEETNPGPGPEAAPAMAEPELRGSMTAATALEGSNPGAGPEAAPTMATTVVAQEEPRPGSALATTLAVFPGILLPGVGHFALGERESAYRFVAADLTALSLLFAGLGGQSATGGSGRAAPALFPAINGGIALLTTLWAADVLGSARGTGGWLEPPEPAGPLALSLGYTGLFGSRLAPSQGLQARAAWHGKRFELEPRLTVMSGSYLDFEGRAGLVLWHPESQPVTRLALAVGGSLQRYGADGFTLCGAEAMADLRLDLRLLSPTLRNLWLVTRLGFGIDGFDYDGRPFSWDDRLARPVLEIGSGLQLTRRVGVELVYRYRKDLLPGGVILPGMFDSFLGFFELETRIGLAERWTLLAGTRWGNGAMPWVALESQL